MSHDPIQRKHEEEANQKGGYGDARKGAELFRKWCSHCHSLNPVEGHGIGPNLAGIVERDIAYSKDYRYSASMKYFYITWTNENLNAFLRVCLGILLVSFSFFCLSPVFHWLFFYSLDSCLRFWTNPTNSLFFFTFFRFSLSHRF